MQRMTSAAGARPISTCTASHQSDSLYRKFAPLRIAARAVAASKRLSTQLKAIDTASTPPTAAAPASHSIAAAANPRTVTYTSGTLSVSANNSSLNQILRQISSDTGMKIIGGVTDERVFGQYGPANPADVLSALLDGTGSNMLIVHRDGDSPAELILTPRQGGPTPRIQTPPPSITDPNRRKLAPQADRSTTRTGPRRSTGTPASAQQPPNGDRPGHRLQPDSPNGVKTPQQIYEQLQRMRQQQQQPPQPQ